MMEPVDQNAIALVGLAGRFPGARDVRELWRNLCAGVESIRTFTDAELQAAGIDLATAQEPNYVRARAVLDDSDKFDASFFGITPRDAELTDPQHRIFLECAWHALEDAALDPTRFKGSVGVFAGSSLNTYLLDNIGSHREQVAEFVTQFQADGYPLLIGNDKDYLATRVSYKLDLRGPSITVQTACSTSLVAVCQAVNALLNYQCDAALAGGVSITFPQERGYLYNEGAISSADGHCRPFDANAQGTVFGHGCGVVVLKRLADALADRDHVYAVIKGAAVNNDGAGKVSYTAPSVAGQAEVISLAHALAGIEADSVSYVEAHGTATPLGDPIEVEALTQAFRATSQATGFCKLGTLKSNFGHLEAAAGVTGLIKTALALEEEKLPPTLHFQQPNPRIDFARSPFEVITALTEWPRQSAPRRAGVSSFGVGGTNAHVVLEEAPAVAAVESRQPQLLILSAKSRYALEEATTLLADHLRENPTLSLADVAFTLQQGRRTFEHRRFLVAESTEEAARLLRRRDRHRVFTVLPGQPSSSIESGESIPSIEELTALGHQWLAGSTIDWSTRPETAEAHRVSLPGYSFERQRYWIEPQRSTPAKAIFAPEEPIAAPTPAAPVEEAPLFEQLKTFLADQSGLDLRGASRETSLLELGFDSLFLTQIAIALQRKFGLRITLRQLLGDLADLGPLADYVEANRQAVKPSGGVAIEPALPSVKAAAPATTGQHGPFRPLQKDLGGALTPAQERWLADFVARYAKRTAGSKRHTAEHRAHFSDPRAVAGFKQVWKEMVYPIVVNRSQGAYLWDVDGHQYVDTTQGFGLALFGHQPGFVMKAIEAQMKAGMEIGPSSPLAGEVAQLLCEMTGHERATFCNTGSEAVLGAIRIARTVTGKNKIAIFSGAYHGINDEVLVRPLVINGEWRTAPIAPGIIQDSVANVLMLEYGHPQSLDLIRQHAGELAAVLVEPVQSRRPDLQPREFLQSLRALTQEHGVAMIMDEVITGFRSHPGGAQAVFGVKGDIATYGKIIGGGLPIGAITGRAEYLDAFDGGAWQYGDDSYPTAGVTFFAGTFVRHPLALAAAKAVLLHLKEHGPALQNELAERTATMVRRIAPALAGTPFEVPHFSSVFYVRAHDFKYTGLLYALLRHRGIHIWEGRPCFLGTAHTDADIDKIVTAFGESLEELRSAGFFGDAPVLAATDIDSFPLSEAQREIWLATQLSPSAGSAFNETCTLHLRGPFDESALVRAVNEVVRRHDALRSTIANDGASQTLAIETALTVPTHDFSALPAGKADEEFQRLTGEEGSRRFELDRGPLVVFQLVKLAADHHALVFTAHHIACDGWSYDIVLRELGALYSSYRRGEDSTLGQAKQFADYLRWEAEHRDSAETRAATAFWVERFRTLPAALDLPTDRPRPLERSFAGARTHLDLSPELRDGIAKMGAKNGATLFAVLLAGFASLLRRLTGQSDLVIGVPAAGQNLIEGTDLVGHCANLLPLRLDLAQELPFAKLLASVRDEVLNAFEHQQFTFGTLLQQLKVPREAGRVPLVPVIFNLDPPLSDIRFEGLEHEIALNPRRHYQFDLGFNIVEENGGLCVECDYNSDLFDEATITRWLGHYGTLLASAVADSSRTVTQLPLLTANEREQILVEWNATARPFPATETLDQLFARWVTETPEKVALIEGSETLTYHELDRRARHVAADLHTHGLEAGGLVGLPAERSVRFIVGLLGILKAGGAYVPLDDREPADRLETMKKSCAQVLDYTAFDFSSEPPAISHTAVATGPAYVLFTSGSTGVPKGVIVPHTGVTRLVVNNDYSPFAASDIVAFASNVCFDAATFEIWGALLNGGTLVITPHDLLLAPQALERHLDTHAVSVLFLTTSLFNRLAHEAPAMFRKLRHLVFGGEAADVASVSLILEHGKPQRLVNGYGPTETTTFAVCHNIESIFNGRIPIGRPIANTTAYVLDAHLNPAPIGVAGEIYLGGPGVALGYLNTPDLTAERFVSTEYGRLYKTGDLARWLPTGLIEYLGRADSQIKLRGFRIEPGEIEAALRQQTGVHDCRVCAATNGVGPKLVAYYIPNGSTPTPGSLRSGLARMLPDYMIPAAFISVPEFPLTANGKLDVRALPAPQAATDAPASGPLPRNELEQEVTALWAELLGRSTLSTTDDFFDLGGHSLLAIQMIGRIREKFGVDLPARRLFETPTIAGVAAFIAAHRPAQRELLSLVPIQRGNPKRRPFFLVPGGWGGEIEFLVYAQLTRHLGADLPFYGLKARGSDGVSAPHASVTEMVADYIAEIRTLQPHGPYLLGGECIGGIVAYEIARQFEAQGEKIDLLVLLDTDRPTRAGLKRFVDAEIAERRQRFWEVRIVQPAHEHIEKLSKLSFTEKVRYVWQRTLGRRPRPAAATPTVDPTERKIVEGYPKVLLAHDLQSYRGRVTLLIDEVSYQEQGNLGWDAVETGGLDVHVLPGDHVSYIRAKGSHVANKLRELLESATHTMPTC